MKLTPILSFLPRVLGKAALPLGGEKVHRTFSSFRLAPHEGGRDVLFWVLVQGFLKIRITVRRRHEFRAALAAGIGVVTAPGFVFAGTPPAPPGLLTFFP